MSTLGIIGCGSITRNGYIPVIRAAFPDWQLLLHDQDTGRMQRLAKQNEAQAVSLEELIAACDQLILATPPASHFSLLRQLIGPGKTILCEKPFLYSFEHARLIREQAELNHCAVYAGHLRRLFPQVRLAQSLMAEGIIDNLHSIHIYEGSRFAYSTSSDYTSVDRYGGVLLDTGSHALDTALFVSGLGDLPLEISVTSVEREKAEPAHAFHAHFILNREIKAELKLSRYEPLANRIVFTGETGSLELPAGIRSYVRFKGKGQAGHLIHCTPQAMPDFKTLLQMELEEVFLRSNIKLLGADQFMELTRILDVLYHSRA